MSLYEELGIDKDATQEEIKKAYLKKANETHPDKGGSNEGFQVVQHAYGILKDPKKKDYYDQTGQEQKQTQPFDIRFSLFVSQHMLMHIYRSDIEHKDMAGMFRDIITECVKQTKVKLKQLENDGENITTLKNLLTRLKMKPGKKDYLKTALQQQIDASTQENNQQTDHWNSELEFLEKTGVILEDYDYTFEEKPQQKVFITNSGAMNWFSEQK